MLTPSMLYLVGRGYVPWTKAGTIESHIAHAMGALTRDVLFSEKSYLHIKEDHPDIADEDLFLIPDALRRGLVIVEPKRERWATICFQHPQREDQRFIMALKAAGHGKEIFIRTFHRMHERQTHRMLRRGYPVRLHK